MATIIRPTKNINSDRHKQRQKYYQDTQYRKIRDWYIRTHPLCEKCGKPAQDCHHIRSPFTNGLTEDERYALLRDEGNFISLCRECHQEEHNNVRHVKIYGKDFT